jgi:hypothetical protein
MADSANVVRWVLALGGKFLRIVPGTTTIVIAATLVSQLAMLLAYLLPLKVLILLGSDGVPSYFPDFLASFDHRTLVVALGTAAGVCYLLHLLAERIIDAGSDQGAKRLLAHGRKMILFEDQDEIAARSYRRYAHALACGVFVLLAFGLLIWVYPRLAMFAVTYILVAILFFVLGNRWSASLAARLRNPRKPVFAASGLGFLCAFVWMVADFLGDTPPAFFSALIGLLLCRQLFSRTADAAVEITNLYAQRVNLNALFFHRQVLLRTPEEIAGIWALFVPERRTEWVVPVVSELAEIPASATVETRWQQTGIRNVLALEVGTEPEEPSRWLLRLYDASCSSQAINAATLLGAMPAGVLPTPVFLGATTVDDFHCHAFRWSGLERIPPAEVGAAVSNIMKRMLEVEPPPDLVARYGRSHPYLWQRLDRSLFTRLLLVAEGAEQRKQIGDLDASWDEICRVLQMLPLVLINPELNAETLRYEGEGEPVAVHWGRWSLDPLGTGWSTQAKQLDELSACLEQASTRAHRAALSDVSPAHARLAACVHAMEQLLARQQYVQALQLIPRLLGELDSQRSPVSELATA